MTDQLFHFTPPPLPTPPRHRLRTALLAAGAAFLALVAIAAVAGRGHGTRLTAAATTTAPAAPSAPADTASQAAGSDVTGDVASVGATAWFTYEDGLQVQVTRLHRFTVSEVAAGGRPGDAGVVVSVTIRNGTGRTFDASLAQVSLTSGPDGDQDDSVFDVENGLAGGFEGSIPVGRKVTARYGFAVPRSQLGTLRVEVAPGFEYTSSFFEGGVH